MAISLPASAMPMMIEVPRPRWQHSSAVRITSVLPVESKAQEAVFHPVVVPVADLLLQGVAKLGHGRLLGAAQAAPDGFRPSAPRESVQLRATRRLTI